MRALCHARCHDSLLRSWRPAERPLDSLECGPAADRDTRCPGACGWSRPVRRRPGRLGGDRADARYLRLAALCVVLGAVFGPGVASRIVGRRRSTSSRAGLSATTHGLAATLRAGRGTCDHPLAMAHTGALCLGPRQRACLLADADFVARKRLAALAGDPSPGAV